MSLPKTFRILDLAVILLALWAFWSISHKSNNPAKLAIITSQAGETSEPLDDKLLRVRGPLGETVFEFKGGGVRALSSPCEGKICLNSGTISKEGEVIVCAPNKVALRLWGGEVRVDAISR